MVTGLHYLPYVVIVGYITSHYFFNILSSLLLPSFIETTPLYYVISLHIMFERHIIVIVIVTTLLQHTTTPCHCLVTSFINTTLITIINILRYITFILLLLLHASLGYCLFYHCHYVVTLRRRQLRIIYTLALWWNTFARMAARLMVITWHGRNIAGHYWAHWLGDVGHIVGRE